MVSKMRFLNEGGQEITLKRSETLPGYEVTLAEDMVIDSAVNNPFFKGINVLQLPKKLKSFRNNSDLQTLLKPQKLNTGIKLDFLDNEIAFFEADPDLTLNKKLNLTNHVFGSQNLVQPYFVNMGINKVKLSKGTVIGVLVIFTVN